MTLSQYIRENTSDGTDIARVLIDVMEGRLGGAKISHRLTAARLLTIYGHKDADDFIADNTPDVPDEKWGQRVRVEIDPAISSYIKQRSDGGREICLFLIEVVQGKVEGIHVGHRVWAAKELLNRAYGKSQSPALPKSPGPKTPGRPTNGTRRKRPQTPEAAAFEARVAERVAASRPAPHDDTGASQYSDTGAAQSESAHQPEPEASGNFDPEVYRASSRCIDPNFDPMLAATDRRLLHDLRRLRGHQLPVSRRPQRSRLQPQRPPLLTIPLSLRACPVLDTGERVGVRVKVMRSSPVRTKKRVRRDRQRRPS